MKSKIALLLLIFTLLWLNCGNPLNTDKLLISEEFLQGIWVSELFIPDKDENSTTNDSMVFFEIVLNFRKDTIYYCLNQCTDTYFNNYENVYCQYYTKMIISAQNEIELRRWINSDYGIGTMIRAKREHNGLSGKDIFWADHLTDNRWKYFSRKKSCGETIGCYE